MTNRGTADHAFEAALREDVSPARLAAHLEVFSKLFRDSGSEDERRAAQYVAGTVRTYGLDVNILEFDSLISWPLDATLVVLGEHGEDVERIPVRTRSFSAATPPEGIEAELVYVPAAVPPPGAMIFSHRAIAGDYAGLDVAGKIVLTTDGGPDGVRRAQDRGAAGHIHIWPSDEHVIHEMIASSVWGTPTPETARDLPAIPVLGLTKADGERLAARLARGAVRVRLTTQVHTAWMRVPLVVASISGARSNDFLLVGAHIDSWYEGITDNATGDAALIEMARVLVKHQDRLHRGVRFCWWPGHSTGRYSGSTWYADTHFHELREHAIGYLNIDSPGVRDTAVWDCRYNTGEVEGVTATVITELTGQEPAIRRPLRAGDQSFLGIGLPSLGAFRMLPLDHPDRKAVGGCGGAYWWHSREDTLDKADPEILADDTRIYLTLVTRLCCPEVLPYDFVPTANDFLTHLSALQSAGGAHLDLTETIAAAERFAAAAQRLRLAPVRDAEQHNRGLVRLSRILNPALFTINGPYEMDPALQLPLLPGLAAMQQLAHLTPGSDAFHFLVTQLRRQRNRITGALIEAADLAERLVEEPALPEALRP
ncbi:MAG: peptidase M28 [Thermomicrobiales bacterium]|nr:MAG: peptidase M28 [Thermomicrobiales bacterium]